MDYYDFDKYEKLISQQPKEEAISDWVTTTQKLRGSKVIDKNCKDCKIEFLISNQGSIVCPECGMEVHTFTDCGYMKKTQAYKRLTHFKDWITKTQAKHNPTIPDNIVNLCRQTDHSYKAVKRVLKQHKQTKLYEDIWYIISVINPKAELFKLNCEEEMLLYFLFSKVQRAWETIKPLKRKSIISYPFIITELLDIINRPHLKVFFPLPRYNKQLEYKTQWKRIVNSPLFCPSYATQKIVSNPQASSSWSWEDIHIS